jgi:hypothetical protein
MADREELIRAVEAKGGSRVTQHGFDRTVIYRLP